MCMHMHPCIQTYALAHRWLCALYTPEKKEKKKNFVRCLPVDKVAFNKWMICNYQYMLVSDSAVWQETSDMHTPRVTYLHSYCLSTYQHLGQQWNISMPPYLCPFFQWCPSCGHHPPALLLQGFVCLFFKWHLSHNKDHHHQSPLCPRRSGS